MAAKECQEIHKTLMAAINASRKETRRELHDSLTTKDPFVKF